MKISKLMNLALPFVAALIPAVMPPRALAQVPNSGLALGIVAARQKNATLLKQYSWNSRVEVIESGTIKDTRIDLVNYGPDGNLQYSLLNDQGAPLPSGFLRKKIAEKERAKTEQYIKDIRALLNQYTLPSAGKVLDFISQATIQVPDGNGLLQIRGSSVVVPGDTVTLAVNAPTRETRQIQVTTFYNGDAVNFTATYKTLNSGLNYMAYATVTIPAKNLTVQVQHFDCVNQNN